MIEPLQSQLERCHVALRALKHCIKGRKWHKLDERSQGMGAEMDALRLLLVGESGLDITDLDDVIIDQINYLDIQLRRVQRQLLVHMKATESDVEILERGIAQADVAKSLLL